MIFHYFIGFELLFHFNEFENLCLLLLILLLLAGRVVNAELLVLLNMNFVGHRVGYFIRLFEEGVARFHLHPIYFLLLFEIRFINFLDFLVDRQLEYLLNIQSKLG